MNLVFRVCFFIAIVFTCNKVLAEQLAWGTVVNLSGGGQSASYPEISLSSDGTKATAVWWRIA
jgi:hypothetical protein